MCSWTLSSYTLPTVRDEWVNSGMSLTIMWPMRFDLVIACASDRWSSCRNMLHLRIWCPQDTLDLYPYAHTPFFTGPLLTPDPFELQKHPPCFISEITELYWHCMELAGLNCFCRKALAICNWRKRLIQGQIFHMLLLGISWLLISVITRHVEMKFSSL